MAMMAVKAGNTVRQRDDGVEKTMLRRHGQYQRLQDILAFAVLKMQGCSCCELRTFRRFSARYEIFERQWQTGSLE